MKSAVLALAATACATSYQSARTLDAGTLEVTVAGARNQLFDEGTLDDTVWTGDLQVRYGVVDRFELGARLVRTPGIGEAASYLQIDPKVAIVRGVRWQVSASLPIGGGWGEPSAGELDSGRLVVSPTVFAGRTIAEQLEVVVAPKLFVVQGKGDPVLHYGAGIGLRWVASDHTWAIHPEVGIVRLTDGPDDDTLLTVGIGIAAAALR